MHAYRIAKLLLILIAVNRFIAVALTGIILSLAIYVQGKIFRGSHASTKVFYLKFFINEIFSVEKFPNYGSC